MAGSMKCWGHNDFGQLGTGSYTHSNTPQNVNLGSGKTATTIGLGLWHTCAGLNDGSLKCWGINTNDQLGTGSSANWIPNPSTVNLGIGRTVVSVSLGQTHSCANLDDGSLKCWGNSNYGQLGIANSQASTPQLVNLGTGRTAVSVHAGSSYTCAILDDGTLKCWGR